MTPWTESARAALEEYFTRVRPQLEASGADPDEVIDDLRRHLEAEVASARLATVTEQDLRRLLARIGAPEPAVLPPEPAASGPSGASDTAKVEQPMGAFASTFLLLTGVILPAATLGIESITHMCAGAFFDPLPTVWHGMLVSFLVVTNALTWKAVRDGNTQWRTALGWANGAAIAVAAFYAFLFIPLVLPGVFAILAFGWGFLPLSPLLALIATVLLRHRLQAREPEGGPGLPGFWRGLLLGMVAIAVAEAPVVLTRAGMQMAVSDSAATQQAGVGLLRRVGKDDLILRACYGFTRGAQNMDLRGAIIARGHRVSAQQAREIYYRVTGTPFNAVPAPTVRTGRGVWEGLEDWTWDDDHGGDNVGGRIRGLSLNRSRLDTVVDADAAWSYTEWTLEFRNDAVQNREARAQLLLPPGGVVSRVTLWVNDEEREAAFAGRSHVREAYQKIAVQQRRDPVLVTTSGPDRVMMQCFPVPADGGSMKVRLGITAPLVLDTRSNGLVRLPALLERNFSIREGTEHAVWVEASGTATNDSNCLSAESNESGRITLHGQLSNQELTSPRSLIEVERDPTILNAWTADPCVGSDPFVRQTLLERPAPRPSRLVVVIDGSAGMAPHLKEIAGALDNVSGDLPVTVLVALDGIEQLVDSDTAARGPANNPVEVLPTIHPAGGQDNVLALMAAREVAAKEEGAAIVWIHAPQPILISSPDALLQSYERRSDGPPIYELQIAPGPDRVITALNGLPAIHSVLRRGSVKEDLQTVFESWAEGEADYLFDRHREHTREAAEQGGAVESSSQIARLWARAEVQRLQSSRQFGAAIDLAARYHLVTPVSGAVVLENTQQYVETGLEPVDPQSVPAIPEPTTFTLFLLGAVALLLGRKRADGVSALPTP